MAAVHYLRYAKNKPYQGEYMKRLISCIFLFFLTSAAFPLEIKDVVKLMGNSVVTIKVETKALGGATGTGFSYQNPEYVVTNHHVIADAVKIEVHNKNGKIFRVSKVLHDDFLRDLAVLKLVDSDLVPIDRAIKCEVGEKVIAIGSSLGVLEFSVSDGIISSFRGKEASFNRAVQTTAPISPGNSGGPLLTLEGKVVGVNTYSLMPGKAQNLNFAMPIDYVDRLINPDAETAQINEVPSAANLCSACKTEIQNIEKTKFCPNCGAKIELKKSVRNVSKTEKAAKFGILLELCRKNLSSLLSMFTVNDALLMLKTLDDIDSQNSVVKGMLSMTFCLKNDEDNARKFLTSAKYLHATSSNKDPELLKRTEAAIEFVFGDDKKGKNILKTLDKSNERNKDFIKSYENQGKDGNFVPPMTASKVEKAKKSPNIRVPMTIGEFNFELWIYERRNPWDESLRYLVLVFVNGLYSFQTNFKNGLPSELQMKSDLINVVSKVREQSLKAWKDFEKDPKFKEIIPYFPEFDGIGWIKEFN